MMISKQREYSLDESKRWGWMEDVMNGDWLYNQEILLDWRWDGLSRLNWADLEVNIFKKTWFGANLYTPVLFNSHHCTYIQERVSNGDYRRVCKSMKIDSKCIIAWCQGRHKNVTSHYILMCISQDQWLPVAYIHRYIVWEAIFGEISKSLHSII